MINGPVPVCYRAGSRLPKSPTYCRSLLVLLRRFVPFEWFESFAVMGVAGSLVAEPTEVGPGQDVIGGVSGGEDEFRE